MTAMSHTTDGFERTDQSLDALLTRSDVWRAGRRPAAGDGIPTGLEGLGPELPGGGWPEGALTEILADREGLGEMSLVLPALAHLSTRGRWIAWVAPPHMPYAPALAAAGVDTSRVLLIHPRNGEDALWAVEQALRSGTCGAVLAWPRECDDRALRRLQLAAEQGRCLGLLFRAPKAAERSSPAALRLALRTCPGETGSGQDRRARVSILKRRGGGPADLDLSLGKSTGAGSGPAKSAEQLPIFGGT